MGHRNPDRVPLAYRRQRCETVERMRRDGWDVISRCEKCALIMRVDLGLVIRVSGPSVSLWNRKARCRRLGLHGLGGVSGPRAGYELPRAVVRDAGGCLIALGWFPRFGRFGSVRE